MGVGTFESKSDTTSIHSNFICIMRPNQLLQCKPVGQLQDMNDHVFREVLIGVT